MKITRFDDWEGTLDAYIQSRVDAFRERLEKAVFEAYAVQLLKAQREAIRRDRERRKGAAFKDRLPVLKRGPQGRFGWMGKQIRNGMIVEELERRRNQTGRPLFYESGKVDMQKSLAHELADEIGLSAEAIRDVWKARKR